MKISGVPILMIGLAGMLPAAGPNWPQFRGPNASGVSESARPPIHFGPETNLLWKTAIPPGVSAPVVWEDRIFLTGLENHQLLTLAYDALNGRELWRRVAPAKEIEPCHRFSSPAAPTPCVDGNRVYVYFGSFGVLAYDFAGNEVWRRTFDRLPIKYGTASSPILAGGNLIVQRDGESPLSQLIALAPSTGQTVWEVSRPMAGSCYSTPMVWQHDGIEELIVQGKGRVAGHAINGGEPKWWVRGWGLTAVTTPVAGDGMLLVGGAGSTDPSEPVDPIITWENLITYDANKDGRVDPQEVPADLRWHVRKEIPPTVSGNSFSIRWILRQMDTNQDGQVTKQEWEASVANAVDKFNADRFVAIRPGAEGDGSDTHVLWETTKGMSEMPSALFYRGRLHFICDGGRWTVIDPRTGKIILDRERLGIGGQAVASPIAANGYIYVVNGNGTFAVLRAGDTLDVVAVNKIGEDVQATPAMAENRLHVRSAGHLWAFTEKAVANH